MAKQMTPLLRPLRDNSGTIYVFPSAIEDIGLNLDSRSNKVCLSKFAVLNLPDVDTTFNESEENEISGRNYFNFSNIPGIANFLNNNTSLKTNNEKIAAALQNYMMNMEVTMLNQPDYDYTLSSTISERVFWKFLKETGAIRWSAVNKDSALLDGDRIYTEESDSSVGYRRVVQSVGAISTGNSVTEDFGMYNETYVNIPTSYGASQIYFKVREDNNYRLGEVYTSENKEYLAGRNSLMSSETYTINSPAYDYFAPNSGTEKTDITAIVKNEGTPWFLLTDYGNINQEYSYFTEERFNPENEEMNYEIEVKSGTDDDNATSRTFLRSRLDGVEVVTDIDELDSIYDQLYDSHPYITYDNINIDEELIHDYEYDFNAILLYYTIYDKNNLNELATNLFGIVFLSSPEVNIMSGEYNTGDSMQFSLPTLKKIKSGGPGRSTNFGTGYSFKINIRSMSIYDNTDAYIFDNTSSVAYTEDFNDVVYQLNQSVSLMNKNSQILGSVFDDYKNLTNRVDDLTYSIQKMDKEINQIRILKFNDIVSENILTKDLDVNRRLRISGSLDIDENTNFNIPQFEVGKLISDELETGILKCETLDATNMTVEKINLDEIYTKMLSVIGTGVFVDNANSYYKNDAHIYRQVIEPLSYEYKEDESFADEMRYILEKTDVAPINSMYEIVPSSFESLSHLANASNLYTVEHGGGYINYIGYVPILIDVVKHLMKEIDELKNS